MDTTISELGCLILLGESAFYDYCINNNIQNPDEEKRKISKKYTKWLVDENNIRYMAIFSEDEYSEEDKIQIKQIEKDREKFQEIKYNFMINYILKHGKYENVVKYCEMNNFTNYLRLLKPCQDSNRQCSFYCPIFNKCQGGKRN